MHLYKYLHPERVDVLHSGTVRFTQPGALNDPFELKPFFTNILTPSQLVEQLAEHPINLTNTIEDAYSGLSEDVKAHVTFQDFVALLKPHLDGDAIQKAFGCALAMIDHLQREVTPAARAALFEGLAKDVGILSLSEDIRSPVMWAYYAADHRGFAIQFDSEHAFFNARRGPDDEFYHLREVVYRDPPIEYDSLLDESIASALVTKGSRWRHEREWRMLAPLNRATRTVDGPDGPVHLFSVPPAAVTALVIGARASPELVLDLREIRRWDRYSHVALLAASLDPRGTIDVVHAAGSAA